MNGLTLRKAGPSDCEFAYCVKKATFREYIEKVYGWDEDEQRRLHEQRFKAEGFRIISVAGTDVGVISADVAPDQVKVNQLFVLPEHQGQGVGRACMVLIIEEARQRHVPVRLRAMKVNPRAQAFYKRLGFTAIGETDTHVLMERGP